mmetsp:Transcript_22757/g.33371  ORF Transcript_22757/g.33371 Transcript_22757/m.33371 type:complete len:81 (+) Transcript_22757:289-531(+)
MLAYASTQWVSQIGRKQTIHTPILACAARLCMCVRADAGAWELPGVCVRRVGMHRVGMHGSHTCARQCTVLHHDTVQSAA